MYEEQFDDGSTYTRLEPEDWEVLEGKRIRGHGEIVGWTNAEGELHPAIITTEDGSLFTPEELADEVDFDGRHGRVDYEVAV